ncbi:hypothetical protein Lmor_2964 [Legionella moravica]|uniref:Uncharacterized protein n=1 Tax=Legionella moravica TaxID=39962 RepID=A0A378JY21_9GAMM|nr:MULTISPECIES: hypothetical protein [Legionella]KTD30857.1 hypothetical protein Lmor_2964 [Legionella moravica]RUR17325.1 hypothetical protein ELY21_11455 [Legionella sp. km535]STX63316.1 Uncharacterised protein [Legionella moravica]
MKEKHYAYKINQSPSDLICAHAEIEEDKMLDLLIEIQNDHTEGIFWIFKQFGDLPKEPLSIIDCTHNRIYYHYSGEVEQLKDVIKKLTH